MAIPTTAIFRVRAGGNAANGSAYDPAVTGGTDYSQQDSPQATFSGTLSTSGANSTTLVVTGATSGWPGNFIKIAASGTNAIAGFYEVMSVTDSTHVVLDRAPATAGALSGGSGRLGGASDNLETLLLSSLGSGLYPIGGNTVFVRGAGTDSPTSADYTASSSQIGLNGGNSTSGALLIIKGENGRPMISGNMSYSGWQYVDVSGILFKNTGTTAQYNNIINGLTSSVFHNNVIDQGGYEVGCLSVNGCLVYGNELTNTGGGTAGTTSTGLFCYSAVSTIRDNNIHDLLNQNGALVGQYFMNARGNIIANCAGNGIGIQNDLYNMCQIDANTIVGNAGDGINIASTNPATNSNAAAASVTNNLICGHTGSGKTGIRLGTGTAAANVFNWPGIRGNGVYNNTTHTVNLTLDSTSVTLSSDPFVGASTQNYALSVSIPAPTPGVAFLQHKSGLTTGVRSYPDIGAVQRLEVATTKAPTITMVA